MEPPRKAEDLALYHYAGCPYCEQVRMALEDLGVEIAQHDVLREPERRRELVEARGRRTVPVLRIDTASGEARWMPESSDIVRYLYERFGDGRGPSLVGSGRIFRWMAVTMWGLLLAGALAQGPPRYGLWAAACAVGGGRNLWMARRSRGWHHLVLGPAFLLAAAFVLLEGLGLATVPWWYGAYALAGALLLGTLLLAYRQRRRATAEPSDATEPRPAEPRASEPPG